MNFPCITEPSPHLAWNPGTHQPACPSFLQPLRLKVMTKRGLHVIASGHVSSAHYTILAQSRNEMMFPDNSPSVSMWPYLQSSSQTRRLNSISVYAARGTSRDQMRVLYMNAGALRLWREMGMPVNIIGETNRPPRTAMLSFGMPFAE